MGSSRALDSQRSGYVTASRAARQIPWTASRLFSTTHHLSQNSPTPNSSKPPSPNTTPSKNPLPIPIPKILTQPHENIYTLPNLLTFSRLALTPVIGYLIVTQQHLPALLLFGYAGFTDLVDGWLARRWGQQTVVGSVVDPMADKALMTVVTGCLGWSGAMPLWLATLILGRDISLALSAIYYRFASLPHPRTLARYWDFSLPSAEVHPTGVSKANTLLQLLLIGATTALPIAGPALQGVLDGTSTALSVDGLMSGAQYTVAATTVWSGLSYLWTRGAVTILGERSVEEKRRILIRGRVVLGLSFAGCLGVSLLLVPGV